MRALATALRTQAAMRAERFRRSELKEFQRPRYPHREELVYYRRLKYFVQLVQHIVLRDIVPHLPKLLDERRFDYDPNQPRNPKGSAAGGQFAGGGAKSAKQLKAAGKKAEQLRLANEGLAKWHAESGAPKKALPYDPAAEGEEALKAERAPGLAKEFAQPVVPTNFHATGAVGVGPVQIPVAANMRATVERAVASSPAEISQHGEITRVHDALKAVDPTYPHEAERWASSWVGSPTHTTANLFVEALTKPGWEQAQYAATQASLQHNLPALQKAGIVDKHGYVTLYRGLQGDQAAKVRDEFGSSDVATVSTRKLSSWTESRAVAEEDFARDGGEVLEQRVHTSRIAATWRSQGHADWLGNDQREWAVIAETGAMEVRRAGVATAPAAGAHPWSAEQVQRIEQASSHGDLHLAAHVMPDRRTEFFVQQGHSREAVKQADDLLVAYGGVQSQQRHAMEAIDAHLAADNSVARALGAASALEQQAFKIWHGGAGVRAQRLEEKVQKAERLYETDRHERQLMETEHGADDFAGVAADMRRAHARSEGAMHTVYRGGEVGARTVESWTTHASGAQTQHHGAGAGSRIKVDHKATVEELNARGYDLLGGIVRMMGAPGEGERTFIRLKRKRTDSAGDIDAAFEAAALAAAKALPESAIEAAAQSTALRVSEWSADQFGRQVQRVVKVNLYDDTSGLAQHLDLFVSDNVKLIKSVAFGQLEDLKGVVMRGARAGTHHTEVTKQIHQQFGVTMRRAATIATDQIGKLNGELNQLRQTNLGIRRYRWSTSRDERVRGKGPFGPEGTEHRRLEGTIQEWKKPPVVNQRTGERGHPGQPIRCRCSAIPIIDDVLADAGLIDPSEVELTHPQPGPLPPPRTVPPPTPLPPTPPPVPPPPVGPRAEPGIDPNALLGRTVPPLAKAQAAEAARLAAVAEAEAAAAAAARTATTQAGREFVATVRKAKPAAPKPYAGLPWTIEVLEPDGTWSKLVSGRAWRYKSAERAEADIQSKHMRRFLKGAKARAVLIGEEPLSVAPPPPPPAPKRGRKRQPAKGRGGKRSG